MDRDAAELLDANLRLVLEIKKGGLMKQGGVVDVTFKRLDGDLMVVKVDSEIKIPLADVSRFKRFRHREQGGIDEITPSRVRLIHPAHVDLAREQGGL